jgi:hypothetical protein
MIHLVPLLKLAVEVSDPVDLGVCGGVGRRMIPITGGSVSGAHNGTILPGADWQLVGPDGCLDIAAHYVLSLEEGLVEVDSRGLRHAVPAVAERLKQGAAVGRDEYYFRTAIRFKTSSPALAYLNTLIAVSVGERLMHCVNLDVFRLT